MATEKGSKGGPPGLKAPTSTATYRAVPTETANIDFQDRTLSLRRTFHVSWWESRTPIEKKLIICLPVLVFVIVIIIVIFAAFLANKSQSSVQSQGNSSPMPSVAASAYAGTCITWDCVQTAALIMESVNRSVDPCDNFFEFACGSRPHLHPESVATHFGRIQNEQEKILKELLETPVSEADIEATVKAKELYKLCLKEPVEFVEREIWLYLLQQAGGSWPLEKASWNETNFDLTRLMASLRLRVSVQGLFTFYVEADVKDPDRNLIYFNQPRNVASLGWNLTQNTVKPTPSSSNSSNSSSSFSATNTSSSYSSPSSSVADDGSMFERGLKEVFDFTNELKKILVPHSQKRNHHLLYNRMTVADMYSNLTKEIDWLKYLRIIFSSVNITIELDEPVLVLAPEYFVKLGQLLNRTSSKVVAFYLLWSTNFDPFESFLGHQGEDFLHDPGSVDGPLSSYLQWYTCVAFLRQNLGMAVSRMYLDEHFKKESKEMVEQIVQAIKAAFSELVDEASWMDDASKKLMKEKTDFMEAKVGYPDDIFNDTKLNELYKEITLHPKSFMETAPYVLQTTLKQSFAQLRQPVDRASWLALPITVNAFYVAVRNEIIVPASVIQTPFYKDINFPSALNFGGIGFVIGHEITHGFGDRGRQYDKTGNLSVWWPEEVTAKFDEQVNCFIEQYNNFTATQSKTQIDGLQTLGENIADNGGLRQAFRAYRRWVKKQGHEEDRLPGLNFSGNQLFFLQFAQVMCSRPEFDDYGQSTKPNKHCPSDIRVLGALSNSYDFAEAYGCKVGSRMNPVRKCTVW